VTRSRFDHLAAEVSVAVGARIPRYPLWLRLHELGADPEALTRGAAVAFCEGPLLRFLVEYGFWLTPRARKRLLKSVTRFDPTRPSPSDHAARFHDQEI
jgi:hypothetical protein